MDYSEQKRLYDTIAEKNKQYNEVVELLKECRDMLKDFTNDDDWLYDNKFCEWSYNFTQKINQKMNWE